VILAASRDEGSHASPMPPVAMIAVGRQAEFRQQEVVGRGCVELHQDPSNE
jgi:hypothetical protein